MKVRSAVLIACLVVVPLVALVSHRVPASLRSLVRDRITDPAAAWLTSLVTSPEPVSDPAETTSAPSAPALVPAAEPPAAAAARTILHQLGAVAVECQPHASGCQASCRVPVDVEGELHRVFQVTAADEPTALRGLSDQIEAWSRRRAARAPAATAERLPTQTLRF